MNILSEQPDSTQKGESVGLNSHSLQGRPGVRPIFEHESWTWAVLVKLLGPEESVSQCTLSTGFPATPFQKELLKLNGLISGGRNQVVLDLILMTFVNLTFALKITWAGVLPHHCYDQYTTPNPMATTQIRSATLRADNNRRWTMVKFLIIFRLLLSGSQILVHFTR